MRRFKTNFNKNITKSQIFVFTFIAVVTIFVFLSKNYGSYYPRILGISSRTSVQTVTMPTLQAPLMPTQEIKIVLPTITPTPDTKAIVVPIDTPTPTPLQIQTPTQYLISQPTPTAKPIEEIIETQPVQAIIYPEVVVVPIEDRKIDTISVSDVTFEAKPVLENPSITPDTNKGDATTAETTVNSNLNYFKDDVALQEQNNNVSQIYSSPLVVQVQETAQLITVQTSDIIQIDNSNNQLAVSLKSSNGETEELVPDTFLDVRKRLVASRVSLFVAEEKGLLVQSAGVAAKTDFPLSVTATNELMANIPQGEVKVQITPERAIEYLDDTNTLSEIKSQRTSISSIKQLIKLVVYNNHLAYEVSGCRREHLAAFIPIKVCMKTITSAVENKILRIEMNRFNQLLDWISI